jgi:hypothetical protein
MTKLASFPCDKNRKRNCTWPIEGSAENDAPVISAMLGNHLEQAALL